MAYTLPQVLVFQEFTVNPAAVANPLRAHIAGGNAELIRYDEADERASGLLGYYDRLVDQDYEWPNRPAGAIVDDSFVRLFINNALLKYFEDGISSGSVITKVSGYNNRVRSATVVFADNGDDYPRDDSLLRDVQAGDIAKVRGVNGDGDSVTLWTYVRGLVGDPVAATVGTATADDDNASGQSAAATVEQIGGAENCVTLTADATDYDGLLSGYISESYDVLVLEGSVNGDYTTAKLRIISASGEDDVAEVTPAAAGVAFAIGTRGLLGTLNESDTAACSASASTDDVSADDLIPGQRWTVPAQQDFTVPVATAAGDYEGDTDVTYLVECTRGGRYGADAAADQPQIKVTTNTGVDLSGPTNIATAGVAVDIGSQGVTLSFTGGAGLRKGDRWTVACTAEAEGSLQTIELGHNIDTEIAAGSQMDVTLFILVADLEVGENRIGFAPLVNFETSETEITVKSGIVAYHEEWVDDDGEAVALDVWSEESKEYGRLYVHYRSWRQDLVGSVETAETTADLDDIPGVLHPDNPLKWGVFKALQNSNGVGVQYSAVENPADADAWADMLSTLAGRDDVYNLVPLTRDRTVLDLYQAHCESLSEPEQGLWRVAWFNLVGIPEVPLVHAGSEIPGHLLATTSDEEVAMGVVEDDSQTSGTQYTILRCTTGNADFLANGVKAGDIVRTAYTSDGFGNFEYTEYVVDTVQAEDQLRLVSGPAAAVNTASKFEVWRTLTATEEAAEIALTAGAWGDRRVRAVWPDLIESSGTIQAGYFACAALAGLASGVQPHRGLTRTEVSGFSDVSRTVDKFRKSQLDAMAEAGVWIITQDPTSGTIYTRHAVTTGATDDLNQREEMVTRNVDSISYRAMAHFAPFIGVTNVTPAIEDRLSVELDKFLSALRTEDVLTPDLGPRIITATLLRFGAHDTLKDRFTIALDIEVPYPMNNLEFYLVV